MHPQPQPCPQRGRALAAILAVAAMVGLLAAADAPPANNEPNAAPPAASTGSGNTAVQTSGNGTQLPVEADLLQLRNFLSMPPERLRQLREMIDKLDNMSMAERTGWRQEVARRLQSIQDLSQEIRGDIRALPKPEDRSILNRYMLTLLPEDIQPLLKSFQDAKDKPEVRQQIIQDMLKKAVALGIKPDPNAADRGGNAPGGQRGNRGRNPGQHSGPPPPTSIPAPAPST